MSNYPSNHNPNVPLVHSGIKIMEDGADLSAFFSKLGLKNVPFIIGGRKDRKTTLQHLEMK
jgi:hypothetical protein